MLGVDIADVIAVGDSDNDSTMIEKAGLGLAVANSCDALKELADYICEESRSYGVLEVIRRYFPEESA